MNVKQYFLQYLDNLKNKDYVLLIVGGYPNLIGKFSYTGIKYNFIYKQKGENTLTTGHTPYTMLLDPKNTISQESEEFKKDIYYPRGIFFINDSLPIIDSIDEKAEIFFGLYKNKLYARTLEDMSFFDDMIKSISSTVKDLSHFISSLLHITVREKAIVNLAEEESFIFNTFYEKLANSNTFFYHKNNFYFVPPLYAFISHHKPLKDVIILYK